MQRTKISAKHEAGGVTNFNLEFYNGPKCLEERVGELEIRRRIETIQAIALLRSF